MTENAGNSSVLALPSRVIRTLVATPLIFLDTVVFGALATVVGVIPPRGNWMYQVARMWSWVNLWISGVRLKVSFEEPLEEAEGYIYMANHQSMYDIPALIGTMPGQVRFMAKKSLFKVPFFGWALQSGGFIPVDRGNKKAAAETYRIAVDYVNRGTSILIFPEQTRSLDGNLLPFKRGGVVIAGQTGASIVPVGITGTRDIRPKGSHWVNPGPVRVRYGKPIEVGEWTEARQAELLTQVRADIERLIAEP